LKGKGGIRAIAKLLAEDMYRKMCSIRVFEEKVEELFAASDLPGFVHLSIG